MADRPHNSFNPAARKSRAQRIGELPEPQQQTIEKMHREHQESVARLKSEQEQQRDTAIQEAIRRRLMQKPVRHHTPDHTPPNYRRTIEETALRAEQEVAGREARDLAYLEQQHEKELGQTITAFERDNRRREGELEHVREDARDTTRERAQHRDRDRER